ncbi:MAG: gfo/Idh/MocA family oxidoreductase, partial [Alkalicoccus sp.]
YHNGDRAKFELGGIQTNEAGGQKSTGVIDAFIESVQADIEPPVPGEEGKKSLEVILAALEADETKRIIDL